MGLAPWGSRAIFKVNISPTHFFPECKIYAVACPGRGCCCLRSLAENGGGTDPCLGQHPLLYFCHIFFHLSYTLSQWQVRNKLRKKASEENVGKGKPSNRESVKIFNKKEVKYISAFSEQI